MYMHAHVRGAVLLRPLPPLSRVLAGENAMIRRLSSQGSSE